MADTQIQFISAEELHKLAEMEKDERRLRTVDGMIDQMDQTQQTIDALRAEAGETPMMVGWAMESPGEFFKLQARLKLANKEKQHVHRVQIGLPMTALDAPLESHIEGEGKTSE